MYVGTWCDIGDDSVQKDQVKYVGMLMRQDISVRGWVEFRHTAESLDRRFLRR
jgi:hypothetical protein